MSIDVVIIDCRTLWKVYMGKSFTLTPRTHTTLDCIDRHAAYCQANNLLVSTNEYKSIFCIFWIACLRVFWLSITYYDFVQKSVISKENSQAIYWKIELRRWNDVLNSPCNDLLNMNISEPKLQTVPVQKTFHWKQSPTKLCRC